MGVSWQTRNAAWGHALEASTWSDLLSHTMAAAVNTVGDGAAARSAVRIHCGEAWVASMSRESLFGYGATRRDRTAAGVAAKWYG